MKFYKFFPVFKHHLLSIITTTIVTSPIRMASISATRIKTFVFFDLETTGLPQNEHNKTKITELSLISVLADHIELGVFPRVLNKLNLCFNPNKQIDPEATEITGLSNELLEQHGKFNENTVHMIENFLNVSKPPVCFVAHNGNRFDFPILRAEIARTNLELNDGILCIDTLVAFQDLEDRLDNEKKLKKSDGKIPFELRVDYDEILHKIDEDDVEKTPEKKPRLTPDEVQKLNETTPKKNILNHSKEESSNSGTFGRNLSQRFNTKSKSYKLADIFTRLTNKPPLTAHEAENDVIMLLTCCATFAEKFTDYANKNAQKFNDIPKMTPGRKIGT